jgi:hypothetical protein
VDGAFLLRLAAKVGIVDMSLQDVILCHVATDSETKSLPPVTSMTVVDPEEPKFVHIDSKIDTHL